jgi:hypothetical protein
MAKRNKTAPANSPGNSDARLLTWLATCVSVLSFLFYYQRHETMLYGDAVAHINIARRVFDSKTPGLLQLGTVWLPLPHLLMVPFLISTKLWRSGAGGSIPSLVAYVWGVVGIFRLVRDTLTHTPKPDAPAKVAAWIAAIIYAANPNLIYMQATAMGEAVYLALFIWAVVFFGGALRGDSRALNKCGMCLVVACLTRYDGWFLAAAMVAAIFVFKFIGKWPEQAKAKSQNRRPGAATLAKFVLIAAAVPTLWLSYNAIVYRNPLEFENGPYSAKAIERRTQTAGNSGHPGSGNLMLAGLYFVKSAESNMSGNQLLQRCWILSAMLALAAIVYSILDRQTPHNPGLTALLLLGIPLPFYALSVAYGGVPIFIPVWWPYTHYNVRYGLQLLPAFAVGFGFIVDFILRSRRTSFRGRTVTLLVLLAFATASYALIWTSPITLQEAQINMRTRNQLEAQLAGWLDKLPPDCTILMYLGDHVGAVQQAGIPLRQVINEGNHRVWMQPSDPDGLWERALADPAQFADYVVAFEGDRVWQAVQDRHLRALVEIHVTGQPRAILYRGR